MNAPETVSETLLAAMSRWKPFKAVVVGDFMLDQIVYGDAERLSPDAPVPVLRFRREENRPGGAANVCLDLAALGGVVRAVGVVGDDAEAAALASAVRASAGPFRGSVDLAPLVAEPGRPTTVKRSLVGLAQARHPQKMFRLDRETTEPIGPGLVERIVAAFEAALEGADVVCLEDYGKGVCNEAVCRAVIDRARAAGVEVLVDPASLDDFSRYRGATAVTPNRTEAERATGARSAEDAGSAEGLSANAAIARTLLDGLALDAVVLTLDRHGALLLERAAGRDGADGGGPLRVPTEARSVYDVTGAGDMMLAGLAAARANGLGWPDAVRLANAAAGLEVEVFGVRPIPVERVHAELLSRDRRRRGGGAVRTLEELLVELAPRRAAGETVVFTNGCFDVLHAGHVELIERAAAMGDVLVVAINSDGSVRRLKGEGRPINTAADRARVLGALRAVDAVVVFEEDTPEALLRAIGPDTLVKGGDYQIHEVVGREIVEAAGGRVALVPPVAGLSSSSTLAKAGLR